MTSWAGLAYSRHVAVVVGRASLAPKAVAGPNTSRGRVQEATCITAHTGSARIQIVVGVPSRTEHAVTDRAKVAAHSVKGAGIAEQTFAI